MSASHTMSLKCDETNVLMSGILCCTFLQAFVSFVTVFTNHFQVEQFFLTLMNMNMHNKEQFQAMVGDIFASTHIVHIFGYTHLYCTFHVLMVQNLYTDMRFL
jgi:hypothetical protein